MFNSVSFVDGEKFRYQTADILALREVSDEVCKEFGNNISNLFNKKKQETEIPAQPEDPFEAIKKLAELKDMGIISPEEFDSKKADLLTKI